MPDGRVLIAFDDPLLEPNPTWTRIDDTDNLVAQIDIRRGRQTELEQTDTSTATIMLNDTQGLFDPANSSSPYFGKIDGKQIMLQLRNPVLDVWVPQWRGSILDYGYSFHPSAPVTTIQLDCVDLFEYLAGVRMIPSQFGTTPPPGREGGVFYDEAPVDERIILLLTDALVPDEWQVVFSGNVTVQATVYDTNDSVLVALRDACDAEMPGIANCYTDKRGFFCFHGRASRFTPDAVAAGAAPGAWNFTRWACGDGAAITLDVTRAQIRPPLQWARGRSRVINAAGAYQRGIPDDDIAGQYTLDTASRDAYGYRGWAATDLIIQAGTTTGNTAAVETALFAEFFVTNYAQPLTRVEALTFRSMRPTDPRADATWALICGVDISDIVNLAHSYAEGVGIQDTDFFVEGSEMTITPASPDVDMVELRLNVSPADYYADDVGLLG